MTQTSAPNPTRIADRLPDSVYLHIVDTLRGNLPDPPSNDPEHRARQLEAAIAEVGAFAPANAAEANLAARYVAFSAHADDCLSLARVKAFQGELDWVVKCRNQANATARQATGQLNLLLRLQKERRKLEQDGYALNRAAWAEHCAIGTMTDALAGQPTPENNSPSPCRTGPEGDRQAATPCDQTPSHHTVPTVEPPMPELESEPLSEALSYAVLYPERAALIRRLGRVPDDVAFDPPDDALVQELLVAQDPVLTMLDERFARWEGPPLRAGYGTTTAIGGDRKVPPLQERTRISERCAVP
jgi:hypothetical protein